MKRWPFFVLVFTIKADLEVLRWVPTQELPLLQPEIGIREAQAFVKTFATWRENCSEKFCTPPSVGC